MKRDITPENVLILSFEGKSFEGIETASQPERLLEEHSLIII